MKLEQQVCSLKLAKKLKELDVKQESLWRWVDYGTETRLAGNCEFGFASNAKIYPAFTVAELGETLITLMGNEWEVCADWLCSVAARSKNAKEADSRAKMIIGLIKEGGLGVEKLAETQADTQS